MPGNKSHDERFAPVRWAVAAANLLTRTTELFEPWPYVVTMTAVAIATAIAWLLQPIAGLENVDLVFLTAIIALAVRYGLWPSLVGSVTSMLAYNFFFIPPLYTFAVAEPTNVAALFFFLLVAGITSHLAARVRAEALSAREQARTTEALYAFSRRIAGIVSLEELTRASTEQITSMLGLDAVLLLSDEQGRLQLCTSTPAVNALDHFDVVAVRSTWPANTLDQGHREILRVGERLFMPLRTSHRLVGVVGVSGGRQHADPSGPTIPSDDERRLLDALIDQAAVALERIRLTLERDEARVVAETERLRSALLTSLSHDLKTPLASITGAVTALRQYPDLYDAAARDELASTIQDEAERLTRFVANLLDMAQLETGRISLDLQPVDVSDITGTALRRTAAVLNNHQVKVDLAPSLPMLNVDATLFEQVLVNLLDNTAKYAPAGSTVTIEGRRGSAGVVVKIIDEGPGLPLGDMERVFEKFYRAVKGDHQRAGTGLGLAICRGFVEALGGTIQAANRSDRSGAVFSVTFPAATFAVRREETAE